MRTEPLPSERMRLCGSRLGIGLGLTGVLFYFGCMLTMSTVPHEQAVSFFNSLLHGLDVAPILRDSIPLAEVTLGIITIFLLGWLAGVLVAGFYNWEPRPHARQGQYTGKQRESSAVE